MIIMNHTNCKEHAWPSNSMKDIRGIGTTIFVSCNQCLAMKINFKTHVLVGGKWEVVFDEMVVEPKFNLPGTTI